MKKMIIVLFVMVCPHLTTTAAAACGGRESIASALAGSTYVFSGRVISADMILARIQVDKIWKGNELSEIVMRTGAVVLDRGIMQNAESMSYSVGGQYVLYASGSVDQLTTRPCGRSDILDDQEIADLDAITPHKKIGTDIHKCTANAGTTAGEIRVSVSSSSKVPQRGAKVVLDSAAKHDGAQTDIGGHVSFSGLQPAEYKITADLDGHTAKQITITVPEKGCIDTALFLSPSKP